MRNQETGAYTVRASLRGGTLLSAAFGTALASLAMPLPASADGKKPPNDGVDASDRSAGACRPMFPEPIMMRTACLKPAGKPGTDPAKGSSGGSPAAQPATKP